MIDPLRQTAGSDTCEEPRMKIDGRCHCGEITFEGEVDPDALNICHCTDCQTLSGSAFRSTSRRRPCVSCFMAHPRRILRRRKAATNAPTPSAVPAARPSMLVL